MRKPMSALLLLLAAAATARAQLPTAAPSEVGLDADRLAAIPRLLKDHIDRKQASGVVTLVARNGKIAAVHAEGLADIAAGRPMTKDTPFWIASMTKPMASVAVMMMVDEGKLSLDDPVGKHIPAFNNVRHKDGKPPARPITLRHLLTHTSGVGAPTLDLRGGKATLAEFADAVAAQPLRFEPGSKWEYGGLTNISVAGRLVEIASGQEFAAFMAERIFRPLGMADTGFWPDDARRAKISVIYKPGKDKKELEPTSVPWINARPEDKDRAPNPSGGLFSTAGDVAAFYQMLLNGGELNGKRLLSAKAVQDMTSVHTGDLRSGFVDGSGWGLGLGIVKEPKGVAKSLSAGSFGHGGAFGTQSWADPKRGMIFILLVARSGFGNSDGSDLRGAFQDIAVSAVKE